MIVSIDSQGMSFITFVLIDFVIQCICVWKLEDCVGDRLHMNTRAILLLTVTSSLLIVRRIFHFSVILNLQPFRK